MKLIKSPYGAGSQKEWNRRKGVSVHGDKFRHFIVKAAIYKVLHAAGHDVRTEVRLADGATIADVVDGTTAIAYEIETGLTAADKKAKMEGYWKVPVEDVIILDPTKLPDDLTELESAVRDEVIL